MGPLNWIASSEATQIEEVSPRRTLPPGPYRSLGGCLDYSAWPERERFMELDRRLRIQAIEGADTEGPVCPEEPDDADMDIGGSMGGMFSQALRALSEPPPFRRL